MSPLLVNALVPLVMATFPPLCALVLTAPALKVRAPPAPSDPVPPEIVIAPLEPVATPVPIKIAPLSSSPSSVAAPVLNDRRPDAPSFALPVAMLMRPLAPAVALAPLIMSILPDTPASPAAAVAIAMSPLDVSALFPLIKDSLPPVFPSVVVVAPALISISPPDPLSPLPTVTKIDPDRPLEDPPEPIYKAPLLPADATPELILTSPVNVPPAAVAKTMFPLEATAL